MRTVSPRSYEESLDSLGATSLTRAVDVGERGVASPILVEEVPNPRTLPLGIGGAGLVDAVGNVEIVVSLSLPEVSLETVSLIGPRGESPAPPRRLAPAVTATSLQG